MKNTISAIQFGVNQTPFGFCFLANSDQGICQLSFFDTENEKDKLIQKLQLEWQGVPIKEDSEKIPLLISTIFKKNPPKFPLHLKGTPFQISVWNALLSLPKTTFCYEDIAKLIGKPKAVRAVASAIAKNNIAYIVPCHRIIRKNGELGQYYWGPALKKALLEFDTL